LSPVSRLRAANSSTIVPAHAVQVSLNFRFFRPVFRFTWNQHREHLLVSTTSQYLILLVLAWC